MGKNGSKNFVNQFKNTRRQANLHGRRPAGGMTGLERKKAANGAARQPKKFPHGQGK
jgi:hypothetical protein